MITEQQTAMDWIREAEFRYGIYNDKTAEVRRYFLPMIDSDKFPAVEVPQELKDLGFTV